MIRLTKEIEKTDHMVQEKKYNEAVSTLRKLLQEYSGNTEIHTKLGSLLQYSQALSDANYHFEEAVRLSPEILSYWTNLANFYLRLKKIESAMEVYENALKQHKDNVEFSYNLAQLYKEVKKYEKSFEIIKNLIEHDPDNIVYYTLYSELMMYVGKNDEIIEHYTTLIYKNKQDISDNIYVKWFDLMLLYKRVEEAKSILESIIDGGNEKAVVFNLYGRSLIENHLFEKSHEVITNALKRYPKNIYLISTMSLIYRSMGELGRAEKYIEKGLDIAPFNGNLLHTYVVHGKAAYGNKYFNRTVYAASKITSMNDPEKVKMHYSLGKIFDDVGDLKTAFEHYRIAGETSIKDKPNEIVFIHYVFDLYKKFYTPSFTESMKEMGNLSNKPVFIVGMPRSGTTLMEQVLSSIDGVFGAGELPYMQSTIEGMKVGDKTLISGAQGIFHDKENVTFQERTQFYLKHIEQIAPSDTKRIIDKMPANFMWLGPIQLLFPNVHILHSRRHPIEVCLSAYRIHFANGQFWSYDLKTMGQYYRTYWEMMKFWKEVLPEGTILDVFYENMVEDLELESKRLADFIGMPWNEKCLEFHKSDKIVRTASITQVRKPIYKTSVDRWEKYAPYLKPLIEEISDLIDEYEMELIESQKR